MRKTLSADELLAGAEMTHQVEIPADLVPAGGKESPGAVRLRPLNVSDIQRVTRAAKEERVLASVLMVQQSLVEPRMTVEQVGKLPAGLAQYLVRRVNEISGLAVDGDDLDDAVRAPLTRACFLLSREFGWTPAECSDLTVGQVLLYLEMIARGDAGAAEATP